MSWYWAFKLQPERSTFCAAGEQRSLEGHDPFSKETHKAA